MLKTTKWDAADYLQTPEDIQLYLEACFEQNDPELILAALGDVARAKGMTKIAKETGLSRENLYRSLSSDGNPSFYNVVKILQAVGLALSAKVVV